MDIRPCVGFLIVDGTGRLERPLLWESIGGRIVERRPKSAMTESRVRECSRQRRNPRPESWSGREEEQVEPRVCVQRENATVTIT